MLNKTVFNNCVKNLAGRGTPSGVGAAQITLGWTGQSQATGYAVLRGTVSGGPYTQVGTTTSTVYNDRSGLKNGDTYYYVVQPLQGTTEICQSNQATITIPK
jgi:fibronectin type 3 domain-containing protein